MTTQNTPGPWLQSCKAGNEFNGQSAIYSEANGQTISVVYTSGEDARLIAAAPELLAALQAIKSRINGVWDDPALMAFGPLSVNGDDDILELATAAIAKATGATE